MEINKSISVGTSSTYVAKTWVINEDFPGFEARGRENLTNLHLKIQCSYS